MNILFMSLGDFEDMQEGSVHIDIIKEFAKEHNVYLVCKRERKYKKSTELTVEYGVNILRVKVGNIKNTNLIEKGISTVLLERQFKQAVKTYLKNVKFDLIIYSTPPITFEKVIKYVKNRDGAKTYLLLKDIFPQNAVDIGMLSKNGVWGLIYKYFRRKEQGLYKISDYIGCMSKANVDYILFNNPEIPVSKVEVCPNAVSILDLSISEKEKRDMRIKYNIPVDKRVFVYGGNLGKPQGIEFMIDCLISQKDNDSCYFLIVGGGTEYGKIKNFIDVHKPQNVRLMEHMPKSDYEKMIASCDVGMIFLDYRFTIPNFPSRLLSYMQAKLPVLAITDRNTDVGTVITEGNFGWWSPSDNVHEFIKLFERNTFEECEEKGRIAYQYLLDNYNVSHAYHIIMNTIEKK